MASAPPVRNDVIFRYTGILSLSLASLAFTAHLLISSRFVELLPFGDLANNAAIGVIIISAIIGVILCIDFRRVGIALLALAFIVSVPASVYTFDALTNQPFSWLSGGLYYGVALVGMCAAVIKYGRLSSFVTGVYWICVAYTLLYVTLSLLLMWGILNPLQASSLIRGEDASSERAARITMLTAHVTFVIGVTLASLRERLTLPKIIMLAVCIAAVIFAQTRFYTALIVLVAAGYLVLRSLRVLGWLAWIAFLTVTIASLYVAFSDYNPFLSATSDISGIARAEDIEIVHRMIDRFWIFGSGIASGDLAYAPLTKSKSFYPSDIGMVGQLFSFGIVGVIAYSFQAFSASFASGLASRLGVPARLAAGLGMTGIVTVLYSVLAPIFTGGSAAVFGALFLALLAVWRPTARTYDRLLTSDVTVQRSLP